MPSKKRSLLAAAGNAGSDPLYVEDVFSTYLYTGTSSALVINNGIALGDTNYGASVEFNGTSDSLTRASDFSGNADGNSFTFSCWCFKAVDGVTLRIFTNGQSSGTDSGLVVYAGNNDLGFTARNSADTTLFEAHAYTNILPVNVWTNVLISVDLSSASNRYIYMNDVDVTSSFTFSQYTNGNINFTTTTQNIGKANNISSQLWQGKLSSLFLDYTYRDLSVTGNRRLFITADGQPAANQASLNPIMFMPLDDTNAIGKNLGTGGDFTANGPPTALSQGGPYIEAGYGEGGLVWGKRRDASGHNHVLQDTVRGAGKEIQSDLTNAQLTRTDAISSFNSNGFSFTGAGGGQWNTNGGDYVSWTFRKAEKFFDIVTYTGDGVAGKEIAHNLGSIPQAIIVKRTDTTANWVMYHWRLGNDAGIVLNTASSAGSDKVLNNTTPTSTVFAVTNSAEINASGGTYVAYLFAEEAAFGGDEDEYICQVDRYNGNGSTKIVNLGFEPQWLLVKKTNATGGAADWIIVDSMRGITSGGNDAFLAPNSSAAEIDVNAFDLTATGFTVATSDYRVNTNSVSYIYMAIRRPMKTPESGTEVFAPVGATTTAPLWKSSFPVDMGWYRYIIGTSASTYIGSRLTGTDRFETSTAALPVTDSTFTWDYMNGWFENSFSDTNYVGYNFKRGAGFMDVVCYAGNSTAGTTQAHNLTVVPELIIWKSKTSLTNHWITYSAPTGVDYYILGPSGNAGSAAGSIVNSTLPTASVITLSGQGWNVNNTNSTYIALLFATLAGISKVGSYTGTGADLNVDCGFTGGARFILIKRTDTTGDWFTYDSFRGITAGNDPYLLLNTTAAQVTNTDYIDPLNAGFTVTSSASSTINVNGGTYIFLAIA